VNVSKESIVRGVEFDSQARPTARSRSATRFALRFARDGQGKHGILRDESHDLV
jgi:hypothetical protein